MAHASDGISSNNHHRIPACRVIRDGELFLMNWDVRDSLDGRYFGPVPASSVIGRALPLWTDEEGDGRYEWRAATH